jgi:hypothetical protein
MDNDARIEIAEAFLHGLGAKYLSQVTFAPDVTLEYAITPTLKGTESVEFLEEVFSVIKAVRSQQCVGSRAYTREALLRVFQILSIRELIWRGCIAKLQYLRPSAGLYSDGRQCVKTGKARCKRDCFGMD